jgi:hypothetical protein
MLTGYDDVDHVLGWFLERVRALFGVEFVGMYLYGSLALGDFDSANSDIDFVVVADAEYDSGVIEALRDMHAAFEGSGSPKAGRIEAVYTDREGLRRFPASDNAYPQVEADRGFFVEPLEMGWIFQCWTLRERGVVLAGPHPSTTIPPLDPDALRRAAAPVALMWQRAAREDPTWIPWLRDRPSMSFVVLTLCRLLYTLDTAQVASKPAAARWAQHHIDIMWSKLIDRATAGKYTPGTIEGWEEQQTLALIDYTVRCFREHFPDMDE